MEDRNMRGKGDPRKGCKKTRLQEDGESEAKEIFLHRIQWVTSLAHMDETSQI